MTEKEVRDREPEEAEDRDDDDGEVEGFRGPWYAFPPARNALVSGTLA